VELPVRCDGNGERPGLQAEVETAVLLARTDRGWGELSRLATLHATVQPYDLATELCDNGDLYVLARAPSFLEKAREMVPAGLLFAELVAHEGIEDARRLAAWAEERGIPAVASNDVWFVNPEDQEIAAVLAAMRRLKTIGTLTATEVPSAAAWLVPPSAMERAFRWHPAALANAAAIADDCTCRLALGIHRLPRYDRLSEGSSLAELRRRCIEHLPGRFPQGPPPEALARLSDELGVVARMGFADYLLMVHDIAGEAAARGIRTFGRGSAAASIICYLLQITHVDPIRYNLTFERFMNDARTDLPDIDLDFPWNRRDEIVAWVYERFGHERVAMIATHATFRARGGLREVAKAMGVPDVEIGRVTRRIPHIRAEALDSALEDLPECRDLPLRDEPWKSIARVARRIDGFPRHISVHPCGIVIAPSRLDRIMPLENAAKGLVVTQMDMYPVEDLGLVKMDLLGQRTLAVISDTLEVINRRPERAQASLKPDDLGLDPPTRALMRTGASMGCFYIESPGMRSLLAKLKVETFETLTAASSVIRPGPADSGMMKSFVERACGREPVRHLHAKMEELLGETFGVMIYQEDVMRVAHEIAGMSMADADRMRRSMTKKRFHEPIARLQGRFMEGAAKRGVGAETAEEIWRQVSSFAGYAFCKSHSASFAQVSIQAAHLKVHYPAEFMAAVLTNGGGFYTAAAYLQEARRLGLRILPPWVDKALIGYQGRERVLMVGLMAVKNVSAGTMERIVALRPYRDLGDFLTRVRPARDEAESLAAAGALDRFGFNRPQLMWLIQNKQAEMQGDLLEGMEVRDLVAPPVPDYPLEERLRREQESLDFTVSAHPLALYAARAKTEGAVPASEFRRWRGKAVSALGWLVHSKRTRTSRGDYMMFMSMEDLSGAFETVLFPQTYDRFGAVLRGQGPYLVFGKVVSDAGVLSINAQEVKNLG
jgi:DNA-directed DNA polymerase III PolC